VVSREGRVRVTEVQSVAVTWDNGGRRSGIDRRKFTYSDHIPERRLGKERRSGLDRRTGTDRRFSNERRLRVERRAAFKHVNPC
jgi:hypothetical protein